VVGRFCDLSLKPARVTLNSLQTDRKIHFRMCSQGGRAILRWSDYGVSKIKQLSSELIKRSRATYDSVGLLAPNNVTYENTLKVRGQW